MKLSSNVENPKLNCHYCAIDRVVHLIINWKIPRNRHCLGLSWVTLELVEAAKASAPSLQMVCMAK